MGKHCQLLHHYYPNLLSQDLLHWDTNQNIPGQEVDLDAPANNGFYELESDTSNRQVHAESLTNDKANCPFHRQGIIAELQCHYCYT